MKKSIILLMLAVFVFGNSTFSEGKTVWSVQMSKNFKARIPDPDSICWKPRTNHFSWQAGYIMFAMEKMWNKTGDSIYFNYIKRYVDQQVDKDGNIPGFKNNALDNFLPGYAILFMYEQTGLEKYKIAATHIRDGFNTYPRTNYGLFYHAVWTPGQAWVDGVFMGEIFLIRYAKTIGDREYAFAEVVKQMTLIAKKCQKPNGLLIHGWDESKKAKWADKTTGLAPEVWSEGLGWYAVLMADVFDYLPENQPGREHLMIILRKLCAGLKSVQDPKTGMWCQVVDKPNEPGNWNETSGTGMFIYLLQKSINKGYISKKEFQPVVEKAYHGIIKKAIMNKKGLIDLIDCSSIGIKNSYADYIDSSKEVSPFSAFGSFILGTSSIEFK
jgi:rhamnogalacturonyl hydrolase YesR